MKPPLIKCGCCDGTGKRRLRDDHWRTLQAIRRSKKPCVIPDLTEEGVTSNAINNRCVELERLGLIKRTGKQGKFILWQSSN